MLSKIKLCSSFALSTLTLVSEQCLACMSLSEKEKELIIFQIIDSNFIQERYPIPKNSFYKNLLSGIWNYKWRSSQKQVSIECKDQIELFSHQDPENK